MIPVTTTNSTKEYPKQRKGTRPQLPSSEVKTQPKVHATDVSKLLELLSISTFYDFGLVREYAIRAIETNGGLDPVDKICYANQCDVPEWLFTAYKELSRRSATLEVSEAERIGLTTTILIAKARERIIRDKTRSELLPQPAFSWPQEKPTDPVDAIINSVFFNETN